MVGATKLCWPLEGKYKPGFSIEFMDGKQISLGEQDEVTITVYPKSEVAQIASNKTIIDLTLAAYIIGAFGALNIIYQLWIST